MQLFAGVIAVSVLMAPVTVGATSASAPQDGPVSRLVERYRDLDFYADSTTSVLAAESVDGEPFRNENRYEVVFDAGRGARIDGYLGQLFLISGWDEVTNWIKHSGQYSIAPLDLAGGDWRTRFVPLGGMIDSEHPVFAMMLDRALRDGSDGLPGLVRVERVTADALDGRPATRVEGTFAFSAQGINFGVAEPANHASGTLWIDAESGFLRRAEYDVTDAYSTAFEDATWARLTVTHDDIRTRPRPAAAEADMFAFSPRATDVEVAEGSLFRKPAEAEADDGTTAYLLDKPAPGFSGVTLSGERFSLGAGDGRPRILYFWATWCPNCAVMSAGMDRLASARAGDVEVVGVNVDSFRGAAAIAAHHEAHGLGFTTVLDPDNSISALYRAFGIPATFVIDATGLVRRIDFGITPDPLTTYSAVLRDLQPPAVRASRTAIPTIAR